MRTVLLAGFGLLLGLQGYAAEQKQVIARTAPAQAVSPAKNSQAAKKPARKPSRRRSPWDFPSYGDPGQGDDATGEDPLVRQAAVEAIGNLMGTVLVADPNSGRILSIVNQQLAFESGYQPCSTFKPAVALAALEEGVIEADRTRLRLGQKWVLDLKRSLAISNNPYFEKLGSLVGMEKLRSHARRWGFGEPAGWGIEKEPAGVFPQEAPSRQRGGVGKLSSFGEGISLTAFQLASFTNVLANGGTLYYLQYPRSAEEILRFEPRVKRTLDLEPWLAPVREGMREAVLTGTARRAQHPDVPIFGKTGTCSENRARLGWFAGYSQQPEGGLTVVVLLRGGQPMAGPYAAEIAGRVYRNLADLDYVPHAPRPAPRGTQPTAARYAPAQRQLGVSRIRAATVMERPQSLRRRPAVAVPGSPGRQWGLLSSASQPVPPHREHFPSSGRPYPSRARAGASLPRCYANPRFVAAP